MGERPRSEMAEFMDLSCAHDLCCFKTQVQGGIECAQIRWRGIEGELKRAMVRWPCDVNLAARHRKPLVPRACTAPAGVSSGNVSSATSTTSVRGRNALRGEGKEEGSGVGSVRDGNCENAIGDGESSALLACLACFAVGVVGAGDG